MNFLNKNVIDKYPNFLGWHLILIIVILSLSIGLGVGLSNNSNNNTESGAVSGSNEDSNDNSEPGPNSDSDDDSEDDGPPVTLSPAEICNNFFFNVNKIVVNNIEGDRFNIKTMINNWNHKLNCFATRDGFNNNNIFDTNLLITLNDFRHISNWDTSNVTDMSNLFEGEHIYNNINTKLSLDKNGNSYIAWDTSNVTNMNSMFKNSILNFRIDKWNTSNVTDMGNMFEGSDFNNTLESNNIQFDEMDSYTCWNTSNVNNMSNMFKNSIFNNKINLDTINVNDMSSMFENSRFNKELILITDNVRNMNKMFKNSNYNRSINHLNFENVTDMSNMFEGTKFNQNITFNTATNVNMNEMFLNSEYNRDLITIKEKLENPDYNITWINILTGSPAYNRSGNDFFKIFKVTDENIRREVDEYYNRDSTVYTKEIKADESHYKNICNWDTSEVTDMSGLFERKVMTQNIRTVVGSGPDRILNRYILGSNDKQFNFWDTSNVTNMEKMFYFTNVSSIFRGDDDIPQIRNLYLRPRKVRRKDGYNYVAWDTSKVTNMQEMFSYCKSVGEHYREDHNAATFHLKLDITGLITSNVTNMHKMFLRPSNSSAQFNQNVNTKVVRYEETDNDVPTSEITTSSTNGTTTSTNGTTTSSIVDDIVPIPGVSYLAWDTSNVTDMMGMFSGCTDFNKNIGNWNTNNITNMMSMFSGLLNFNQDLSNWDTSNVTNMRNMFANCNDFNQDLSNFNTSNVTNMSGMFYNCFNFNQDLSNFNTSNVTNMNYMFSGCNDFNQDLNTKEVTINGQTYTAWDVSKVTGMNSMFNGATNFNGNISNWDVSNVTRMLSMFKDAHKFNQPIGQWNITIINTQASFGEMFVNAREFNQDLTAWPLCRRGGNIDNRGEKDGLTFRLTNPGSDELVGNESFGREMIGDTIVFSGIRGGIIHEHMFYGADNMDIANNVSQDCTVRTTPAVSEGTTSSIAGFTTSSIAGFTSTSTGTD